jgi:hypothetical protein
MRASRQNSLPIRLLSLTLFVVAASSGPLVRPASGQDQPVPAPSEGADAKAAAENEPKQEKNEPLSGHSYHGEAFNEGPRQAAVLLPGMGAIKFPSAAQDETVRGFVNQGVAALHGFWYLESERSFRQAAKLQPDLAIAYWGMAMANANNQKRAREFIAEATERRDKASRHEQMYIDALAKFLAKPEKDENADQKKARQKKYIEDLEAIINEFPDDIDARGRRFDERNLCRRPAPPCTSLPDPLVGRCAPQECDRIFCQVRPRLARHRPHVAHARSHLFETPSLPRRDLAAGGLGPQRPCAHDPHAADARPDP